MSKRYSGKSFKDSSVIKKQKFKKGSFYCPFFLINATKLQCQKDIAENHLRTPVLVKNQN